MPGTAAAATDAMNDASPDLLACIGGGNMARALIGGLVAQGRPGATIRVADPDAATREALARDFGVATFADGADAVDGATTWLLAVKPQVMRKVCEALAPAAAAQRPLVVSIAAGITAAQLSRWLGGAAGVVRAMPNTPALLGAGVTGLFADAAAGADGLERASDLLAPAGRTVAIDDEAAMDAVTAISGSGPAYVFLLAEALADAARAEGLPDAAARVLVEDTLLGAARMLVESGEPAAELRRRVTSPGGTTAAAIASFEGDGFATIVARAVHAARIQGATLSAAHDD